MQKRERYVQKSDVRAKLLFYLIQPIVFVDVLVAVASLNLKVPMTRWDGYETGARDCQVKV